MEYQRKKILHAFLDFRIQQKKQEYHRLVLLLSLSSIYIYISVKNFFIKISAIDVRKIKVSSLAEETKASLCCSRTYQALLAKAGKPNRLINFIITK